MTDSGVVFEAAEVRIAGRRILGPLTLSFGVDERWAVLGPNGSGKTTLLRLAGAMRQPSAGSVTVMGGTLGRSDVRALRERIAHVGHAVADLLPPSLGVRDVVLSGKRGALVPWMQAFDDGDRRRADALLERFGCGAVMEAPLSWCSQGERQRVLLARALFGDPALLLFDEPAAGLDLGGRETLIRALDDAEDLARVPSILVTHHVEELPATTTHVGLLREGRMMASGPIDEVLTSENLSACFGIDVLVARNGRRWTAAARG
jgi:iron complex transport system ATP-binding protein